MTLVYASILGLHICFTDFRSQKIDKFTILTYGIVLTNLYLKNKQEKIRFFQEIFLVADIVIKVILEMLFLAFSKVEINFANRELTWKTQTLVEVLPTTNLLQIIDLKICDNYFTLKKRYICNTYGLLEVQNVNSPSSKSLNGFVID